MSEYKRGERWRMTFDGVIDEDGNLAIRGAGIFALVGAEVLSRALFSAERLPDPEPEWRQNDVVLAADGCAYQRSGQDGYAAWWRVGRMAAFADRAVPRPLTPLARNGKPWPQDGAP